MFRETVRPFTSNVPRFSSSGLKLSLRSPSGALLSLSTAKCGSRSSSSPKSFASSGPFVARSRGPILLKGIVHPHDAELALDAGMDGIVVSNHGGRQVDGAVAALEALPAVAHVVGGSLSASGEGKRLLDASWREVVAEPAQS